MKAVIDEQKCKASLRFEANYYLSTRDTRLLSLRSQRRITIYCSVTNLKTYLDREATYYNKILKEFLDFP